MTEQRKHEMYLWGGVIGGGAILFFVFVPHTSAYAQTSGRNSNRNSSPPPRATNSRPAMMQNPQQANVDEMFLQAKAQALATFDQTVLGEKDVAAQLEATNNETAAQKAIAFNQDATQYKITGLQTTASEQIAQEQYAAQEQIAQQQSQAYQSSQPQWYDYLLSGLGSIGSMFGFSPSSAFNNIPWLNPVSYGSADVNFIDPFAGLVNPQGDQYNLPSLPEPQYTGG